MSRPRASRRVLDRALWAAVIVLALLLPLATLLVANASGAEPTGAAPSAEEASAVLGGVQRLLHAAAATSVESALAAPPPAPAPLPSPTAASAAAVAGDGTADPSVPLPAGERRRL